MTLMYPNTLSMKLQSKLLPAFRTGHTRYVDFVKENFRDGCRWLDAGGGRKIFHDPEDGEQDLVHRSAMTVVCDGDVASLKNHETVKRRVCATLERVPLPSRTFDLITCAMVVEHLSDPTTTFQELSRLLDRDGKLILHTVNLWSYPTLLAMAAKLIPSRLRSWLISKITSRHENDIFPTRYACNTARAMSAALRNTGLKPEVIHLSAGPVFRRVFPIYVLELLYIRLTSLPALKMFRGQLLVIATKP